MFKSWGTWLGIESTPGHGGGEEDLQEEAKKTPGSEEDEVNKREKMAENQAILQQAKGLSGQFASAFYFHVY